MATSNDNESPTVWVLDLIIVVLVVVIAVMSPDAGICMPGVHEECTSFEMVVVSSKINTLNLTASSKSIVEPDIKLSLHYKGD